LIKGFKEVPEGSREVHGEMIELYKGYEIKVFWSNIEKGYVFCVFSMDGEGIMESSPYFYEENALLGAKETIERIIQRKGK